MYSNDSNKGVRERRTSAEHVEVDDEATDIADTHKLAHAFAGIDPDATSVAPRSLRRTGAEVPVVPVAAVGDDHDITEAANVPSVTDIGLPLPDMDTTDVGKAALDSVGRAPSIPDVGRPLPTDDPLVGEVLMDRYRVERCIGRGGMSKVYLGRHVTIGKEFAIKVLAPQLAEWPVYVERFLKEARAASMIRHPNVVDITDFGYTDKDRLPFFVMEYLEGEDLRARLSRVGRLAWREARPIALQMCSALEAAHRRGVIHRDIKPENCFILKPDEAGELVKLLDFGIAKVASDQEPGSLTSHGVVLGTVEYISPERANKHTVDARADIYSLGVLLYHMLAGHPPFQGDPVEVVTAHVYRKPPPPTVVAPDADIVPELEAIVMRTLAKQPEKRYQTAAELAAALQVIPLPDIESSGFYSMRRAPTVPPPPPSARYPGQMPRKSSHYSASAMSGTRPHTQRTTALLIIVVIALMIAGFAIWGAIDDASDPEGRRVLSQPVAVTGIRAHARGRALE